MYPYGFGVFFFGSFPYLVFFGVGLVDDAPAVGCRGILVDVVIGSIRVPLPHTHHFHSPWHPVENNTHRNKIIRAFEKSEDMAGEFSCDDDTVYDDDDDNMM